MTPKHSSGIYNRYEENDLRQYWCSSALKFLQNRKRCVVLPVTAIVSVFIAFLCMHADAPKKFIAPMPVSRAERSSFCVSGQITDGKVNIAVADAQTLASLYGIGDVLSERIIDERENEPFHTIEDIMKVSGIGLDKFEKLKNKITLGKE